MVNHYEFPAPEKHVWLTLSRGANGSVSHLIISRITLSKDGIDKIFNQTQISSLHWAILTDYQA